MQETLELYDYHLPQELIAQHPLPDRDQSRMMVLKRGTAHIAHQAFHSLPRQLPGNALLVMNNTRVQPLRLTARLPTGPRIEALLVERLSPFRWRAMVKKAKRVKPGMKVPFANGHLMASAVERTEEGEWLLDFEEPETFSERLEQYGLPPLPPYIHRAIHGDYAPEADKSAYQTCYASREGAIAAPTAGLHFTPGVLKALDEAKIDSVELTLHVGAGTFLPIKTNNPEAHTMHREWYEIPDATAVKIQAARQSGRPVIAVGTTTVRALESWARAIDKSETGDRGAGDAEGRPAGQEHRGYQGWSGLFIRPPFDFRLVDGMITNFHLPKSTLLLLVSAFHGRENLLAAYQAAINEHYRFYSFGDCMAILP